MEEKEKEKELRMDEAPFNSRKHLKLLRLYIGIREEIVEVTQKHKGIREELLKLAQHNFK